MTDPCQIEGNQDNMLLNLRQMAGEYAYERWLCHLKLASIEGNVAIFEVHTKLIRDFIVSNYFHYILKSLQKVDKSIQKIEILVATHEKSASISDANQSMARRSEDEAYCTGTIGNKIRNNKGSVKFGSKYVLNRKEKDEKPKVDLSEFSRINQAFTFDSFVQGEANLMSYIACKQVAEKTAATEAITSQISTQNRDNTMHDSAAHNTQYHPPKQGINGLCVYGASGIGKTHLLQAIVNHVYAENPNANVGYFTAERFTHCYVHAVKNNTVFQFKDALSQLDLLVLDDMQFICGRSSTEKEFIAIFDHMLSANRCVVTASDVHPNNLKLDARGKSRLSSCITVKMDSMSFDLKVQMLKSKLLNMKSLSSSAHQVNDSILYRFAERVSGNARELEGALYKLITYADLMNVEIDDTAVSRVLLETSQIEYINRKSDENASSSKIEIDQENCAKILDIVCLEMNVAAEDVLSKSRKKRISIVRQAAAYIMRQRKFKLVTIGKVLDRNHATISYMINKFSKIKDEFSDEVMRVYNQIT